VHYLDGEKPTLLAIGLKVGDQVMAGEADIKPAGSFEEYSDRQTITTSKLTKGRGGQMCGAGTVLNLVERGRLCLYTFAIGRAAGAYPLYATIGQWALDHENPQHWQAGVASYGASSFGERLGYDPPTPHGGGEGVRP